MQCLHILSSLNPWYTTISMTALSGQSSNANKQYELLFINQLKAASISYTQIVGAYKFVYPFRK